MRSVGIHNPNPLKRSSKRRSPFPWYARSTRAVCYSSNLNIFPQTLSLQNFSSQVLSPCLGVGSCELRSPSSRLHPSKRAPYLQDILDPQAVREPLGWTLPRRARRPRNHLAILDGRNRYRHCKRLQALLGSNLPLTYCCYSVNLA
jgi:hypothetical protein